MRRLLEFAFLLMLAAPAWPANYYIDIAAHGASDSNNGTSPRTPWLTANHPVNCNDVLTVAVATYPENNFYNKFGTVSGTSPCVAILKCAIFDACYLIGTDGNAEMWVGGSHWMIWGFEIQNPNATSANSCFKASPTTASTNLRDVWFVDDIANGCPLGGFVTAPNYHGGQYSTDYVFVIASVAYNAAQSNRECASGASFYKPVNSDTKSGTHLFVDQFFAWGNANPPMCGGTKATDGEGIIFDDLNGEQRPSFTAPYTGQAVAENSILLFNGTNAVEAFTSPSAAIYIKNNTGYADGGGPNSHEYCGEFVAQSGNSGVLNAHAQITNNIAKTTRSAGCGSPYYAFLAGYADSTNVVAGNFAYSAAGNNTFCWGTCTGFSFGSNTFGTDPAFASPPVSMPPAPNCSAYASVPACMAALIAEMTPTAAGAAGKGYQPPSSAPDYDPLYPQALCAYSKYLNGLVTQGCAADSSSTGTIKNGTSK